MLKMQRFTSFEDAAFQDTTDDIVIRRVEFMIADHSDPSQRTEWIEAHTSLYVPLEDSSLFLWRHALSKVKGHLEVMIRHYDRLLA